MTRWHQLPQQLHTLVACSPGSVLLQTARFDPSNQRSLLFLDPVQIIAAHTLEEVPDIFRRIEQALAEGFYTAGFLSYECGYHFERFKDVILTEQSLPLAWFGIYRKPLIFDHETGRFDDDPPLPLTDEPIKKPASTFAESVTLAISQEDYTAKIERIKEYIAAGETYQVNFTSKVSVPAEISSDAAFATLLHQQPVAYSALLNVAGHQILSLSPELFFRIEQGKIITRPMKGTMPRGLDSVEDERAAIRLQDDEKNRCEHVMIVDLLRNDIGRICEMGSVQVDDIFSVETYQTLLQMTSTVSGTLRHGLRYYDIFKSVFPSGSITGAPKIRTMEIIHELEASPRGIYTGSIGYMAPDGSAAFNVAIRTLDLHTGKAQMGVGGGIVADSDPEDEYSECLLKAEFLIRPRRDFQLIETMLWNEEFRLLSMHLDRMESSASYFGYTFDRTEITQRLIVESLSFEPEVLYRVRLLLAEDGELTISHAKHTANSASQTGHICLSSEHTSSADVFLRHKTTLRKLYDSQYAKCRDDGFDEVIFLNERDEVTEGAISNIFIRRAGELFTPPLRAGVLPGVFRRHILETDATAKEKVLTLKDLESADAIYLCNSLRGMREVKLSSAASALHTAAH
ncbi:MULTISPECIES: aminodeoxychorismate synthase component I [Acidobacteriaceae]|uniref:aminodeoxychorismate synthase component I n=1 Tax=Acidobacteriaceae TaxID=204434 RepID=UPI00131EAB3F|nr:MULTISPECIES: aminodeoxychorismate synthase component I [Acidobacteriaceae]MDW5267168.1 aminodeoxychorismate synthase component I [Edaphobacter sp.]